MPEFNVFLKDVCGDKINDNDSEALFKFLDKDKSGGIDRDEFEQYLFKGIDLDDL